MIFNQSAISELIEVKESPLNCLCSQHSTKGDGPHSPDGDSLHSVDGDSLHSTDGDVCRQPIRKLLARYMLHFHRSHNYVENPWRIQELILEEPNSSGVASSEKWEEQTA